MSSPFLGNGNVVIPDHVVSKIDEHVVPLILDAMEITLDAYSLDKQYNDNYTIGAYGWRNLYNRFFSEIDVDSGVEVREEAPNDLVLVVERYKFRVHKVNPSDLLPRGGKAAKRAAKDLFLPLPLPELKLENQMNLYIGYVVDSDFGVKNIFLGNMVSAEYNSEKVVCDLLCTLYNVEEIYTDDSGVNVIVPENAKEPKQLVGRHLASEERRNVDPS